MQELIEALNNLNIELKKLSIVLDNVIAKEEEIIKNLNQ